MKAHTGTNELHHFTAGEGEYVRFEYSKGDYLEVTMKCGMLRVRSSGGSSDVLSIVPEVANAIHIYPLRWNDKHRRNEMLWPPAQTGPERSRHDQE